MGLVSLIVIYLHVIRGPTKNVGTLLNLLDTHTHTDLAMLLPCLPVSLTARIKQSKNDTVT